MATTHRIRRKRWQVVAPNQAAAFSARQYLRQAQDADLLPALEAAFDAVAGGETVLRIPRLELKVRVSCAERLAEELPEELVEAVTRALAAGAPADPDLPAWDWQQPDPQQGLRHYLAFGQVAWFDARRPMEELQPLLASQAARWSRSPPQALQGLAELTAVRLDVALLRLLQLLAPEDLARWADYARQSAQADVAAWLTELLGWQAQATRDPALRLLVIAILLVSVGAPAALPAARVLEGATAAVAAARGAVPATERERWATLENRIAGWREAHRGSTAQAPAMPWSAGSHGAAATTQDLHASQGPSSDRQAAPGLPVLAAGLVLLHPWLPRLFATLGWVAMPPPRDEAFPWQRLPQALALLHWLATGREEPLEFELGTAKLLLGLTPEAAAPVAGGLLDDDARREGLALLEAVIGHWSALGHTSVDGLRVAFLQRAGLLQAADEQWLLRPQPESYDLLLGRLPWGIGLIRLPWMPKRLQTEWNAP
jgi:hypothetical protein